MHRPLPFDARILRLPQSAPDDWMDISELNMTAKAFRKHTNTHARVVHFCVVWWTILKAAPSARLPCKVIAQKIEINKKKEIIYLEMLFFPLQLCCQSYFERKWSPFMLLLSSWNAFDFRKEIFIQLSVSSPKSQQGRQKNIYFLTSFQPISTSSECKHVCALWLNILVI